MPEDTATTSPRTQALERQEVNAKTLMTFEIDQRANAGPHVKKTLKTTPFDQQLQKLFEADVSGFSIRDHE